MAGLETLKRAVKKIKIPIVAIGGINEVNIKETALTGVKRIAVVRAILKARNPYTATRKLRRLVNSGRLRSEAY